MIDIRCPDCGTILTKVTFTDGAEVEGYCSKCRLEVTVKKRLPKMLVK